MAASACASCGGSIPDGYAFCPICSSPVIAPAPTVPPPLHGGRLALLVLNAALLIIFAALGLLAVVAPPTAGAGPAAPTATLPLTTVQATVDVRSTPTTLGRRHSRQESDCNGYPRRWLAINSDSYGNPSHCYSDAQPNCDAHSVANRHPWRTHIKEKYRPAIVKAG